MTTTQVSIPKNPTPFMCFDEMHTDTAALGMCVMARSAIFQCAIAIKQGIAEEAAIAEAMRIKREKHNLTDLDVRNEQDEAARAAEAGQDVREEQGHHKRLPMFHKAEMLAKIHAFCYHELLMHQFPAFYMPNTMAETLEFLGSGRVQAAKPGQQALMDAMNEGEDEELKIKPERLALRRAGMARIQGDSWKTINAQVIQMYESFLDTTSAASDPGLSGLSVQDIGSYCFTQLEPKDGLVMWDKVTNGIRPFLVQIKENVALGLGGEEITPGDCVDWSASLRKEYPMIKAYRQAYFLTHRSELAPDAGTGVPSLAWTGKVIAKPAPITVEEVAKFKTNFDELAVQYKNGEKIPLAALLNAEQEYIKAQARYDKENPPQTGEMATVEAKTDEEALAKLVQDVRETMGEAVTGLDDKTTIDIALKQGVLKPSDIAELNS